MSRESASKLAELIKNKDEQITLLMEGWNDRDARGSVERLAAAAREAGWDVADDELAEAFLGAMELRDDELDAVTGGWGAVGSGNCTGVLYKERCAATVEEGSWCLSNDYCNTFSVQYHPTVECGDHDGHH